MPAFVQPARLIERAVASHAFPAATIEVGRRERVLWRSAFGNLTYAAEAPPASDDTLFDLASLTKVIATATLVMRAVDTRTLALTDRVADRLPAWRAPDREDVTIADLLEHASGLTAYLPFFRDHRGRAEFEHAICTLPLEYPPRTRTIYSDLGFILLGFILEDVNRAPLARQFDQFVRLTQSFRLDAEAAGVGAEATVVGAEATGSDSCSFPLQAEGNELLFNPPRELRARCAPTELDLWRGRLLQGEVHDENTWELGGAAGHAGLFGTAASVGAFARLVLDGFRGGDALAKRETIARFAQKSTVPGSSRAMGWDMMLPTSSCGARLSPRAIGHTGFTGTSLWIDPAQDLYVVFLTNRVHPTRDNNQIQAVRRALHDEIVAALQGS